MRSPTTLAGLISGCIAIVFSVTNLSHLVYIPSMFAFVFGLISLYFVGDFKFLKTKVQVMFLLTIIALSISTLKSLNLHSAETGKIFLTNTKSTKFL